MDNVPGDLTGNGIRIALEEYKDMFLIRPASPPSREGAVYESSPEAASLGGWGVSVAVKKYILVFPKQ